MLWNFVISVSALLIGSDLGTLHLLRVVHLYRKMSEYCLRCLYVLDIVHLVGTVNEYTDPKCVELTTVKHVLVQPALYPVITGA